MQLAAAQLSAHLAKPLRNLYVVHGDEPLLAQEALDAIRDGLTLLERDETIRAQTTVDTLAACYAAVGQYPRAVELQQQVIADMRKRPAPALANIKEMEARLALYRAGKPYIEVPAKR